VITLLATDEDCMRDPCQNPSGQVKYRFLSGSKDHFSIDTSGSVTVGPVGPLDFYDKSVYNISVCRIFTTVLLVTLHYCEIFKKLQ